MSNPTRQHTNSRFWLVWPPASLTQPHCRHTSYAAAKREAERLAEVFVSEEFFVVAAISRSQKTEIVTHMIDGYDREGCEVPF